MSKRQQLLGALCISVVMIGAGCMMTPEPTTESVTEPTVEAVNTATTTVEEDTTAQEPTVQPLEEGVFANDASAGTYALYTEERRNAAEGDVVLFFHAPWCPTCKVLHEAILNESASIPEALTILQVDFDSSLDLRREHGVTLQHTLVQVDNAGNQITKWSGGSSVESIASRVQ